MKTIYQFDPADFDLAVLPAHSAKRRDVYVRNINDVQELFFWMWEQLEASQPRVAVYDYGRALLGELFETLSLGEPLTSAPTLWAEIFGQIKWNDSGFQDAEPTSVALLAFMGHLCWYVRDEGSATTALACEMMFDCAFHSGKYIKYGEWSEESRLIVSTPACERLLGVKIQVRVTGKPLDELWWCS